MAEVDYLHVCDYSFIGAGGKPGLIGIFDNITASSFPVSHPYMSIALQLRGTAHQVLTMKLELGRPNGDVLLAAEGQVAVNQEGVAFMNFNFMQIVFPEAGRYTVKVSSEGKTLVSHSLRVLKTPHTPQAGPQGAAGSPTKASARKTGKPH